MWRRGEEDFLLLTEPGLGERSSRRCPRAVRGQGRDRAGRAHVACRLRRARRVPNVELGEPLRAARRRRAPTSWTNSSSFRIEAATPVGARSSTTPSFRPRQASTRRRHLHERLLSGQEPIARLHYRGHANREPTPARPPRPRRARTRHRAEPTTARSWAASPAPPAASTAPSRRSHTSAPTVPREAVLDAAGTAAQATRSKRAAQRPTGMTGGRPTGATHPGKSSWRRRRRISRAVTTIRTCATSASAGQQLYPLSYGRGGTP